MIPPPRNILVSYHYYRKYDLDKLAGLRIIGDSGAYSARMQNLEITNDELAAWITRWRHRLCWAASLDVAGDTATTRCNWMHLVDRGIPAVSSLHVGTHPSEMDWYVERGVDFLGLGGMAGGESSRPTQFRWLISVFRYARDNHPQMRFHGWGVTDKDSLKLPFFSVDSSSWGSGFRYGCVKLRDPYTGKTHSVRLNGRETYTPEIATLLRDSYGVNPSHIAVSGPHNYRTVIRISALSASVLEQKFRQMHRRSPCSAPQWGRLPGALPVDGPHVHLAGDSGSIKTMYDTTTGLMEYV